MWTSTGLLIRQYRVRGSGRAPASHVNSYSPLFLLRDRLTVGPDFLTVMMFVRIKLSEPRPRNASGSKPDSYSGTSAFKSPRGHHYFVTHTARSPSWEGNSLQRSHARVRSALGPPITCAGEPRWDGDLLRK